MSREPESQQSEERPVEWRFERVDSEISRMIRHETDDDDMDITPMIDVTFLLLIFFMVVSQLDPSREVLLPEADNGASVSARDAVTVTVSEGNDGTAEIYLGDGKLDPSRVSTSDLAAQETAVQDYVRSVLTEQRGIRRIMIKAERRVKHRDVARVARAAESAAELPLYIAVTEVP